MPALKVAEHERVVAGELERHRAAFLAPCPQDRHGFSVDIDDTRLAAMCERALTYMKYDFAHKTLVLFEAVARREEREKAQSQF